MSRIGAAEVERLAKLARIGLSPSEVEAFSVELEQIREFVEQLNAVDVSDLPPTDQVTGLTSVMRPDEVHPADQTPEQLLANAPQQQDGYIVVGRVPHG